MAKISGAGASDTNVDPDYIAPPGMAPADAIEQGIPDAGQGSEPVNEPEPVDEPAPAKDEAPAKRGRKRAGWN